MFVENLLALILVGALVFGLLWLMIGAWNVLSDITRRGPPRLQAADRVHGRAALRLPRNPASAS